MPKEFDRKFQKLSNAGGDEYMLAQITSQCHSSNSATYAYVLKDEAEYRVTRTATFKEWQAWCERNCLKKHLTEHRKKRKLLNIHKIGEK